MLRVVLVVTLLSPSVRGQDVGLCFEAESAFQVDPPMRRVHATDSGLSTQDRAIAEAASGGAYLEIPQGAGNPPQLTAGAAKFLIEVPRPADYILWARVWWEDECGNSFTMRVDNQPAFVFGQDSTVRCWHWVRAPPRLPCLSLSAGEHLLVVSNREDGARIDQILLTADPKYVPVGIERVRSAPLPKSSGPQPRNSLESNEHPRQSEGPAPSLSGEKEHGPGV